MSQNQIITEITKLLQEFIDYEYNQAGEWTGCYGNNTNNREIVKKSATLENFLRFLLSKNSNN